VTSLRSRRLESLFGTTVDQVTAEHIESLVENAVTEDFDLDFKRDLYERTDQKRRDLAGDVAAMANSAGGVIILGVDDEDGRAAAAPGVPLTDEETRRMHQVVASLVAPMPTIEINVVSQHGSNTSGFYIIAVPRSRSAPHAVLVNDALRFPRRNGTTTRYLSEPEVALAYRDRQAGAADQRHRLDQICDDATRRVNHDDNPWLLVALIPDLAGDMGISSDLLRKSHGPPLPGGNDHTGNIRGEAHGSIVMSGDVPDPWRMPQTWARSPAHSPSRRR
jgi:hypothetical protein